MPAARLLVLAIAVVSAGAVVAVTGLDFLYQAI
jgi:hypothetical protein